MAATQDDTSLGSGPEQSPTEQPKFTIFMRLPPELRLIVWELALPSPHNSVLLGYRSSTKTPKYRCIHLRSVCQESKKVALKALDDLKNPTSTTVSLDVTPFDIDFENDEIHLDFRRGMPVRLSHAELNRMVRITGRIQILFLTREQLLDMVYRWNSMHKPDFRQYTVEGRSLTVQIREVNMFIDLYAFPGGAVYFQNLKELNVVIDGRDSEFSKILTFKYLHDVRPDIYKSLRRRVARTQEAEFFKRMDRWLELENWQREFARDLANRIKSDGEKYLGEYVPDRKFWKYSKTPKLNVLYPRHNATLVVTHRGDMDKTLDKLRRKQPWDFVWPKVEIQNPEQMEKLPIFIIEEPHTSV